ncbi:MAG: cupin domain-containing protein [Burkholderiaceae bacterium]
MSKELAVQAAGKNFATAQAGAFAELTQYEYVHASAKGKGFPGKLFLQKVLGLTSMEVSLNNLPAGKAMPFSHRHHDHEELYIFVSGKGQFQIDGQMIEVREGTVIRIAPEGSRIWRNHSTEDLCYVVIQATANSLRVNGVEDGEMMREDVVWPDPQHA